MRTRTVILITLLMALAVVIASNSYGARKKRLPHHEYGNVLINRLSSSNNMAPVVFNHWLHRSKYTCRLCHTDLGFAMKANGTGITESSIGDGKYCGACHDGKTAFASGSRGGSGKKAEKNCNRCHSYGKKVKLKNDFYQYTKTLPRARFGNGVNWMKAEEEKLLNLKDDLSGTAAGMGDEDKPRDTLIKPKEPEMPQIIFSHNKHALWNGCDLCHPEPFVPEKGGTSFSMEEIFAGKFCGKCHGKVSFPTLDCQRCHTEPTIIK